MFDSATYQDDSINEVQDVGEDDEHCHDVKKLKMAAEQLERIQAYVDTMNELQVDDYEYACLRALSLFGAGMCSFCGKVFFCRIFENVYFFVDISPLRCRKKLWLYQQKCVQALRNNIQHNSSNDENDRYCQISSLLFVSS